MTEQEAVRYIESHGWSAAHAGLGRTRALLSKVGDPHKKLRFVHVTGSNGKGSTCAMLASVLQESGYRVGLYTSPYIQRFGERMQVNGSCIPGETLGRLTETVKAAAETMEEQPSQFELTTAIGMLFFAEEGCDIVVLEVGMGGALDSTNVIDAPEAAILTNIGLEHTEYLGDTIEQIARTKAGIIKPGCSCVFYDSTPEAAKAVREICRELQVPLTVTDFDRLTPLVETLEGQTFLWDGAEYRISLLGKHQLCNTVTVLTAVETLRARGWSIPEEAVKQGLFRTVWPARLEVLHKKPLFLLDGGHNPQCAKALADSLQNLLQGEKAVFLMGILGDKDYDEMTDLILPYISKAFCMTPDSPRALSGEDLAALLQAKGVPAEPVQDGAAGISAALKEAGPAGKIVCFGSLYLAGEIRTLFPGALKKQIRSMGIRARNSFTPEERARRSEAACRRIMESDLYKKAGTLMIYRAVRGELSLALLEEDALRRGKRLVYPLCTERGIMIGLYPMGPESFAPGSYGISEPLREKSILADPADIDLVLCPCSAFDDSLRRMGMGLGYYDRYLAKCANAVKAAVAFEGQKAPIVPAEPHDIPMDLIFTEERVYLPSAFPGNK